MGFKIVGRIPPVTKVVEQAGLTINITEDQAKVFAALLTHVQFGELDRLGLNGASYALNPQWEGGDAINADGGSMCITFPTIGRA